MGLFFSTTELSQSDYAKTHNIDNTPSTVVKGNLENLIFFILDPLRKAYGAPIIVNSGYRSPAVNKAIGGAASSQHVLGQAADIRSVSNDPVENKKIFDLIRKLNLPFDQLINEYQYKWVHVSCSPRNRNEVLAKTSKGYNKML